MLSYNDITYDLYVADKLKVYNLKDWGGFILLSFLLFH